MTGKLADVVMSVRNGEQVARKYQPVVFNPSTTAQVAQRAKLKLSSQLSALLANYITIPRQGNVSSRNMFTKLNFPLFTYNTSELKAEVDLTSVQLTRSLLPMASFKSLARVDNTGIRVRIQGSELPTDIDRVIYIAFSKVNNAIEILGSVVVSAAGAENQWEGLLPYTPNEVVVYAYAMKDNTENARTKFGDFQSLTAQTIAFLLVTRSVSESDVTVTKTKGTLLTAENNSREDKKEEEKVAKKK